MLLDKVMDEFEDLYKRRLLSVADGTFDGVYSQLFKGTNCKSIEGHSHPLRKIPVKSRSTREKKL